uniref:Uncharacterized protein n=1 Tax=Opuntia streptacantha TaxID=393608 RepID=A0A7C9ER08_OPUST
MEIWVLVSSISESVSSFFLPLWTAFALRLPLTLPLPALFNFLSSASDDNTGFPPSNVSTSFESLLFCWDFNLLAELSVPPSMQPLLLVRSLFVLLLSLLLTFLLFGF